MTLGARQGAALTSMDPNPESHRTCATLGPATTGGRVVWLIMLLAALLAPGAARSVDVPGDPGRLQSDDRVWVMPAKNYASTRFSGLADINAENVKSLQVAWSFPTGLDRGHEAGPLVVNDTLYVVMPFPNVLYAFDLRQPGAHVKWKYEPKPAPAAQGVARCDVVNRGAAYAEGRIFYNTLDGHVVAVDAGSGAVAWKTKMGDINRGESMTMAPLVVRDRVIVGNSGGEFGVRGWIAALDARTGRIAWRAYSTGPDSEALIGPRFKPFDGARPCLGRSVPRRYGPRAVHAATDLQRSAVARPC